MIKKERKKKLFIWLGAGAAGITALVLIFVFAILPLFKKDRQEDRLFNIENIAIQYNGTTVTSLEPIPYKSESSLAFTVVINDGVKIDTNKYDLPTIKWSFVGTGLNNTITDGLVDLNNTFLGEARVKVEVISKNTMTAEVTFTIVAKADSTLMGVEIAAPPDKTEYEEGSSFDRIGMVVMAAFGHADGEYKVAVENYSINPNGPITDESLNGSREITVTYTHGAATFSQPVGVSLTRTLKSISIVSPSKTVYIEGQKLDLTGLKVIANYAYIQRDLAPEDYLIDFDIENATLKQSDTSIRIIHIESGLENKLNITVNYRTVMSINVTGYRTNFIRNQRFNVSDLVVFARYDYGEEQRVFDFNVSNTEKLILSDDGTEVVISYTERGTTVTYKVLITVTLPYDEENLRFIKIEGNPADVRLTWIFTYPSGEGETEAIDYQTYEEQSILYSPETGEYKVPIQAVVTISKINPSITDFFLDGVSQKIDHVAIGFNFIVSSGNDDIAISYQKVEGDRITVRFVEAQDNALVFYFSVSWTGRLLPTYLERINFIFFETSSHIYEYWLDGKKIIFSDFEISEIQTFTNPDTGETVSIEVFFLKLFAVEKNLTEIEISVKMVEREPKPTRELKIVFWEGSETTITVPKDDESWKQQIPIRTGYWFVKWEEINETTFQAIWLCEFGDVDYENEQIIGKWAITLDDPYNTAVSSFTFTEEGNFIYESMATIKYLDNHNEQKEYILQGIYRIEDGKIIIKTVDTEFDYILTKLVDFSFELIDAGGEIKLKANIFIVTIMEEEEDIVIDENGTIETIIVFRPSIKIIENMVLSLNI